MKKLLFTLVFSALLFSCSREEAPVSNNCQCVEDVEYSRQDENYSTWYYLDTRPTVYNCLQNGYVRVGDIYFEQGFGCYVEQRITVRCQQ